MPAASFAHEAHVEAHRETVWDALQSAETWAEIGSVDEIRDPRYHDDGTLAGYDWVAAVGPTTYRGSTLVVTSEPPQRMKLDIDSSEMTGVLEALLVPNGAGTNIRVTLDIEAKGFLSTMFFAIIAQAVGNALPQQVERFADRLGG